LQTEVRSKLKCYTSNKTLVVKSNSQGEIHFKWWTCRTAYQFN